MIRRRRAFSLIETMVAVTILMALTGVIFTFLQDLLATREQATRVAASQRAASTLIDRLERDLFHAIAGDSVHGPGVEGAGRRLSILTRSTPVRFANQGAADPRPFADLERAEYRDGRDGFTARRTVLADDPAGRPDRARFEPLGGDLPRVRFRYYDGSSWRDSFDSSAADAFPQAVEVSIWFNPWPGEEEDPEDEFGFEDEAFDEDAALDEMMTLDDLGFDDGDDFGDGGFADDEDLGPPPDRRRLIIIPDSAADDPLESVEVSRDPDEEAFQ